MGPMLAATSNWHDYLVGLFVVLVPIVLAVLGKLAAWSLTRSIGDRIEATVGPQLKQVNERIDTHMDREERAMNARTAHDEWQAQAILLIAQERGVNVPPPPPLAPVEI